MRLILKLIGYAVYCWTLAWYYLEIFHYDALWQLPGPLLLLFYWLLFSPIAIIWIALIKRLLK